MCSRNTVRERESSYISVFCSGDPISEVVRRLVNTYEEPTVLLEWPAGLSLRLRNQRTSSVHLSDQRISLPCLNDQHLSALSPKLQTLYCLFKSHANIWISSSPTYFSVYGWLSELAYLRFFPCNLLILSANRNICHSIHRQ